MTDDPDTALRAARRGTAAVSIGTAVITAQPILLAVALPEFAEAFDLSVAEAATLNVVYFAPMLALLIPLGRISDRLHRRAMYVLGFVIMAAGAGVVLQFDSMVGAVVGRIIQGVGAATSICINRAILVAVVPIDRRARAMAVMQASSSAGMIAGLFSAGTIVGILGWQAPFILTLPFASVAAASARLLLPDLAPGRITGELRLGSSVLLAGAMLLVGVGLSIQASGYLTAAQSIIVMICGLIALSSFVRRDRRLDSPYLDWELLNSSFARRLMIGAGLFQGVRAGLLVVIPFHVQVGLGLAPLVSSVALAGVALGEVVFARMSGRMYDSQGPLTAVRRGIRIAGSFLLLVGVVAPFSGPVAVALLMLVIGSGSALFQTATNAALFSVSRKENSGVVSSLLAMCISLGLALGSMSSGLFLDLAEGVATGFGRSGGEAMVLASSAAYIGLALGVVLVRSSVHAALAPRPPSGA